MRYQNKQPFYHRVDGLLFTSVTGCDGEKFKTALIQAIKTSKAFKDLGILENSVWIEDYGDPEPGDPSDLM
jgi:hypothetical protein